MILQPVQILACRLINKGDSPTTQLLVQWAPLPEDEATWEYLEDVRQRYLAFWLEVKLDLEGESNVMRAS